MNEIDMNEFLVLSHGFSDQPVMRGDVESGYEVICGAGIDSEAFEGLLYDDDFLERVQQFCTRSQCNQVVVSLRGYPSGLHYFRTEDRREAL